MEPCGPFILCHFYVELFSAEDMEMEVMDRLTRIVAAVGDNAIAARKAFILRYLCNNLENMGDDSRILFVYLRDGGNVLLRDNENVSRCLRSYITECEDELILINLRRGNIPRYYFAKQAI